MESTNRGPLERFLSERTRFIEFLLFTVLLAVGVNLIAGSVSLFAGVSSYIPFSIGAILTIVSIVYLSVRVFSSRAKARRYFALLVYDPKANSLVKIDRYRFSESISDYLSASFSENASIKMIWDNEPLKEFRFKTKTSKVAKRVRSLDLVSEATEYFVLDSLSTHLTDYFNLRGLDKRKLVTFERNDIPEVLLKNRFLELFSKPMEDRIAFVDQKDSRNYQIVRASGTGGAIYGRFDLILPIGSKITRPAERMIRIVTGKLGLAITVHFEGFNENLPRKFEERYLGIHDILSIQCYMIVVDVAVSFKLRGLFRGPGWDYHTWVDSFLDSLDQDISSKAFFDSISWETALTVLKCLDIKGRSAP